jgi:septum formation protein
LATNPPGHTEDIHKAVYMPKRFILASASEIRAQLLRNAGLVIEIKPAHIDESAIRDSLEAEAASPRDVADTLAEYKAMRISRANPGALVLGCDQVAEIKGSILSKPGSPESAGDQLRVLSGQTHKLLSAAVLYLDGQPKWRHVGVVRLSMRELTESYVTSYIERNWESVRHSVGAYKLEEEGVRLFSRIDGDYFHVLGLPLTELLSFLIDTGELEI